MTVITTHQVATRDPQAGPQRHHRQCQRGGHQEQRGVGQTAEGLHHPEAEGCEREAAERGPGDFPGQTLADLRGERL